MTNMKTLMLAAVAALALSAGAASAQEMGSSFYTGTDYWAAHNFPAGQAAPTANRLGASQSAGRGVQSGSSDRLIDQDAGMRAYLQYNPYGGN